MKKISAPSVAKITRVDRVDSATYAITYVYNDGNRCRVNVYDYDWPDNYWPPSVGDLIETQAPRIAFRARPR